MEPNEYMELVDSEEYKELQRDSAFLQLLMDMGVDNWEGFELAQEQARHIGLWNDDED